MTIFTDKALKALAPAAHAYDVREGSRTGFAVRIHPTGRKTFIHWYTFGGRKRRATLGHYPETSLREARERLTEQRRLLGAGIDPVAARQEQAAAERADREARARRQTVAELVEVYIRHAADRKRSAAWEAANLRRHVVARIGDRPAEEVDLPELVRLVDRIAEKTPYMAGQVISHLRNVFNYAVRRGVLADSPARLLTPPVQPRQVDRVLSDAELVAFWRACRDPRALSIQHGRILRLQLLLAARIGELTGMTWDELDDAHAPTVWTLPAGRTKQARRHRRPIIGIARRLLLEQRDLSPPEPGRPVFPVRSRKQALGVMPAEGPGHALRRRVFLLRDYFGPGRIEKPFTPHDLRRTARSRLSALGVVPWVAERILGHSVPALERVYDHHDYLDEMADALARWERYLLALVEPGGLTGEEKNS